jgi:probable HAF family extracellular repeat protein
VIPAESQIGSPFCAKGVSADGSFVVGSMVSPAGIQAYRWSAAGGLESLGDLPGGDFLSEASAVSADGSVVVGYSTSQNGTEAFRWTTIGGMVGLGDFNTGGLDTFESRAYGVSADGTVVVGFGSFGPFAPTAFRWTGGAMSQLTLIGSGSNFLVPQFGRAVSADGTVVVGSGHNNSPSNFQAYRWTTTGDNAKLGDLPGGPVTSAALGVSSDGSVVVGVGQTASSREPFRWTRADGLFALGNLPGGNNGEAHAVSADGSVVVGISFTHFNPSYTEAFIWTPRLGMSNLRSLLIDHGVSGLDDWILISADAVTPDGKTIVGSAISSDLRDGAAWIVTIPEPSSIFLGSMTMAIVLMSRGRYQRAARRFIGPG